MSNKPESFNLRFKFDEIRTVFSFDSCPIVTVISTVLTEIVQTVAEKTSLVVVAWQDQRLELKLLDTR
jgi:hypothetical protein